MTGGIPRNGRPGLIGAGMGCSIGASRRSTRRKFLIAARLALALSACTSAMLSAASPGTGAEAAACPLATFDDFIARFSRDMAFQQRATADPLVVERYDIAAEPEPRRVRSDVALANVTWPVMPRLETLPASGRTHALAEGPDRGMNVVIRTPDTSDQQTYAFGQAPCWQLQRVIDDSI